MKKLLPTFLLTVLLPSGVAGGMQIPDSLQAQVEEEYAAGRWWHGVRLLSEHLPTGGPQGGAELDLLARGHLGWGDWQGLRRLLEAKVEEGDSLLPRHWYYLGRAREGEEDWAAAAQAYTAALDGAGPDPLTEGERAETRLRLGRALGRQGTFPRAHGFLSTLAQEDVPGVQWVALDLARYAARSGAPEETRAFLSLVPPALVRERGWDLPARALLAAGDSVGAEAAYWSAIPALDARVRRQDAWSQVGALRLARGDTAGARGAFHQVLLEPGSGSVSVRVARALLSLGMDSVAVARRGAEALAGAGRDTDALEAWRVYESLREGEPPPEVRLAQARLLLRQGEDSMALDRLQGIVDSGQPDLAVPGLLLQHQLIRRLGRGDEARAVQDSLVARFPNRPEAVEILFLRADALHDRGDLQGAIQGFRATAALSPAQNLAGQARMRLGMIYLARGEEEEAVEVFDAYRRDFPEGRRWDEASFWMGRTLLSMEREEEGRVILEEIRSRLALSFYSVLAGWALGVGYEPPVGDRADSLSLPLELRSGLERLDLYRSADLEEGASGEVDAMRAWGRSLDGDNAKRDWLLRLALELNERGLTREGINLGWEVRRLGEEWSRELLRAIYPFPYRELVMRSAREGSLDPFLMAGLMRQESAFWREAVSRADARGLMQVLPSTGAQLARNRGPFGFDADEHLFRPEINVHLGMAFFSDLRRRFGDDLSILLSAYNAGPTRALRWREFPEVGDLPRFVERIPFAETRGYVKNVLLNREIYAWLYGSTP